MKYLTFVDNINTFNLKNHQVLKLKFPSIKHWQWIYSRGVLQDPPLGLIGLMRICRNSNIRCFPVLMGKSANSANKSTYEKPAITYSRAIN